MTILIAIVIFVLFIWTVLVLKDKKTAQRAAERLRVARLRRHADMEDELISKGDMAGVHGEFPPPPSMRGVGIREGA